jgi:hypothetical protein
MGRQIGRSCMLALDAGDAAGPGARMEIITLGRVAEAGSNIGVDCGSIRTGAGLRFGVAPGEMKRLYPGMRLMEQGKGPSLYRSDIGEECLNGRSTVLRTMYLYGSDTDRAFRRIIVEASKRGCEEYRDTSPKR